MQAHEVHPRRLQILEAELEEELTPEQWLRVLEDIREVNSNELDVDAEGNRWLSDSLKTNLAGAAAVALGSAAIVLTASKPGSRSGGGVGRLLRA